MGFAKTFVKAGAKQKATVKLNMRSFEYWSAAKDGWDVEDGIYEIIVGASVADEMLKAKIKITDGKIKVL